MYTMKVEDGQPYLRNGKPNWLKPIIDERGNFFPSSRAAMKKYDLGQASVSRSVVNGDEVSGHKFRLAKVAEVKEHLGDKVQLLSPDEVLFNKAQKAGKKTSKKAGKKKTKVKTDRTIHIDGALKPLDPANSTPFEGHVFAGGPAVLTIPGSSFSWAMPHKDMFPEAVRNACRWS